MGLGVIAVERTFREIPEQQVTRKAAVPNWE
jgi:hypothetical protein